MQHFGDIKNIVGAAVPPVDIITGGSPCQDLSVAGKRAGLDGERSGLFMEQIRIIKEMRNATRKQAAEQITTANDIRRFTRPRYMVWENVLGAFSSNGGEDFRIVLEETARVADPAAVIPRLAKGQKWAHAGAILGDGWSIAWRVHDAQFWGVPQRRKRIALVADFGGGSAPEILFEREGMRRDPAAGKEKGETIAGHSGRSIVEAITFDKKFALSETVCIEGNGSRPSHHGDGYIEGDIMYTLNITEQHKVTYKAIENHPADSRVKIAEDGIVQTLSSRMGTGGGNVPLMASFDVLHSTESDINGCSQAACYKTLQANNVIRHDAIVRRLTPLECERLQGFPDNWTNIGEWIDNKGKKHKDADGPRYKALGNSIALPFWQWLAHKMVAQYGETACSMASLFDGIGGFPLVFSRAGCVPIWASEIEEFPIAVTKVHFPETV